MIIRYYFVHPKKEKSSMMISVSWNGNRIQTSIGLSHKTDSFDIKNQKFKKSVSGYAQINNHLDKIKQDILDYKFNLLATNSDISPKMIKDFLDSILKNKNNTEKTGQVELEISVSYLVNKFISSISENPLYQSRTIIKYNTFNNNFKKFSGKFGDRLFDEVDYKYLLSFALFLSNKLLLSDATIHKTLKMLSVTFNKALDDNLIQSAHYKPLFKKLFKELNLKTDSQKFSLTKDDIQKIESYIPTDPSIQLTKDLFLFEVYTAQRVSDLFRTNISAINLDEKTLNFRQSKTGDMVSIPLIDKAINIIKKYPNMTFPKVTEQQYNKQIKILAKNSGLLELMQIERKSLKKTEQIVKEKWELISSHHARVTCIVNMAQNGALPEEIIMVSGHKNPRSIEPYMKIAEAEKKKRSRQALERAFG